MRYLLLFFVLLAFSGVAAAQTAKEPVYTPTVVGAARGTHRFSAGRHPRLRRKRLRGANLTSAATAPCAENTARAAATMAKLLRISGAEPGLRRADVGRPRRKYGIIRSCCESIFLLR
ncbi:MAG: hypothetical protein H7Y38_13015 [Armatimonadetes bacterium]|nr:hypothetical protein [Armatimonadota bacterium]